MAEIFTKKKVLLDIKSKYILKKLFLYLNENEKLNMIIYNKQLQKRLDIDIKHYQKESRKFKIGEKTGEGKEYILNTDKLIFEGEYINGKRNGKGKEYLEDGTLKFKGEYLNGKKDGKGEEYYKNGKLKFEGEYKSGKRNGRGKEYYENGKKIFEGDYLYGKIWNGKGYDKNSEAKFEIKDGKGYKKNIMIVVSVDSKEII